jgi:hypothetical protein
MLEPFVTDATIRRVLTHTPSLDLADVIHDGRVLIVDIPLGKPLRLDDVKLFGRFLTNDLANRVFERTPAEAEAHPVFFIVDEAELFLTEDFCHVLRMGREPGMNAVIAHQDLSQLRAADATGNVYGSVMGSCRTKVVFGGPSTPDCRILADEMFFDQWNPLAVKDRIQHLEIEPVEKRRAVFNFGVSLGASAAQTHGKGDTDASAEGLALGRSSTTTYNRTSGFFTGTGAGQTTLPTGEVVEIANDNSGLTGAEGWGKSDTNSETHSKSTSKARTTSDATTTAINGGVNFGVSIVPFEEKIKRRVDSSRTFWSEQETMSLHAQKIKTLPERQFIVKTDGSTAIVCRAPFVPDPRISDHRRAEALAHVYAAPYYLTPPPVNEKQTEVPYQPPAMEVKSAETPDPPNDYPLDWGS